LVNGSQEEGIFVGFRGGLVVVVLVDVYRSRLRDEFWVRLSTGLRGILLLEV